MPKFLKKIGRLFAMEWSRTIQYRTDAFLWMFAEAVTPVVSLAIWYTVAQSSSRGPAPIDVFTYYILVIFIKSFTDAWNGMYMARKILNGNIAPELIRPIPVVWDYIVNNITEKFLKLLLPLPLFGLALFLFPALFSPAIYQPAHYLLFLLSLALAIPLGFLTEHTIGLLAFWLEDVFQIRRYKIMLDEIASGMLIPFSFMPVAAQNILGWLPFRYLISAPAEIMLGQTNHQTVSSLLMGQVGWIVGLVLISTLIWQKGLQRYAVPGQ